MIGTRLCVRYETQMSPKQDINVGSYDYISMYICLPRGLSNDGTCYVAVLMEGKRFFYIEAQPWIIKDSASDNTNYIRWDTNLILLK